MFLQHLCAGLEDLLHTAFRLIQDRAGLAVGDYSLGLGFGVLAVLKYQITTGRLSLLCDDLYRGPRPHSCESITCLADDLRTLMSSKLG